MFSCVCFVLFFFYRSRRGWCLRGYQRKYNGCTSFRDNSLRRKGLLHFVYTLHTKIITSSLNVASQSLKLFHVSWFSHCDRTSHYVDSFSVLFCPIWKRTEPCMHEASSPHYRAGVQCRLLPLKNSSLHAKLGLFSDNRANFIVETDLMRVHFRHFRFVLLGLRIIFASGLSGCSWTRF